MKKQQLSFAALALLLSIGSMFGAQSAERKCFGPVLSAGNYADEAKAFDGDFTTSYEGPGSNHNSSYLGLDLGSAIAISTVKVAPRATQEGRAHGALIQASATPDFANPVLLLTLPNATENPDFIAGKLTSFAIPSPQAYRYIRIFTGGDWTLCNISEVEFWTNAPEVRVNANTTIDVSIDLPSTDWRTEKVGHLKANFNPANTSDQRVVWSVVDKSIATVSTKGEVVFLAPGDLTVFALSVANDEIFGIFTIKVTETPETATKFEVTANNANIVGTEGSYQGTPGFTKLAAFDGDLATFFDAPGLLNNWLGLDFGAANTKPITKIKIAPREDRPDRIQNAEIIGFNEIDAATNSPINPEVIYKFESTIPTGRLTTVKINESKKVFRYGAFMRNDWGGGNPSELSFWSDASTGLNDMISSDASVFAKTTQGTTIVTLKGFEDQKNIAVKLIDMNGKLVFAKNISTTSFAINRNNLQRGIYIVNVTTNNGVKNFKLNIN